MRSPLDPKSTLLQTSLEPGLSAWICPTTGGVWLDGGVYWQWCRSRTRLDTPSSSSPSEPRAVDTKRMLISPRTGRFMRTYRVGPEFDFTVHHDSSDGTHGGGFWFDKGEFDVLREANLLDKLHLIFDEKWQQSLAQSESEAAQEDRFRAILGEDYGRAAEIKSWLARHPSRSQILAYLRDSDG